MLLDPKTKSEIFIRLYQNVRNTKELKEKLMAQEIKCCLIKCSLILEPLQIIVASNKAVVSEKLRTKSIYTEILFNLSISKNISKSLTTFGVHESEDCFLAVHFSEESAENFHRQVFGEEVPLSELNKFNDFNSIKKYYKITDSEAKVIPTIDSIVSRIATKEFLSH